MVEPKVIFKKQKAKLIEEFEFSKNKLEEIYTNEISEVKAPVWLIHTPENIISKESEIIKKAKKSITIKIGFLLENEGKAMIKAFGEIPRTVKIRIVSNISSNVGDKQIDIIKLFEKSSLPNLEVVKGDLPMMKMLIRDGEELFGTFVKFNPETKSIYQETAIGVNNQYADICKNFDEYFLKEFEKIKLIN